MGLLNGIGIGFPFFHGGVAREVTDYLARVAADSGTVDDVEALKDLVEFYKRQGTLDLTQLLAAPFLGSKVRTSGIYKYLSKLYSVELPANDLAQTTELNQPYQSGNIAPNEVLSMQNPNGDSRYLTHPEISFAANQAWSVTWVSNDYGSNSTIGLFGGDNGRISSGFAGAQEIRFLNENLLGTAFGYQNKYGKNTFFTLVAEGNNWLRLYINGVLIASDNTIQTLITYKYLLRGRSDYAKSNFFFYRIQSGAMTATQVLAEYNKLRTYIPEIETVQIGSKYITSSNFQAVATPAGNVIYNMIANSKTTILSEINLYSGWYGATIIDSNTFSTNSAGGVQSGLLTIGKKYKLTWNITSTTGIIVQNSSTGGVNIITSGKWFTALTTIIYIRNDAAGTTDVNSFVLEELGWDSSNEIYNAVYAATSGTAAQKEYAALKEASMWCSYDNSTANQAIYGKLFNQYAIQLLKTDMAAQNFGYHIPTEAEKAEILATYTDANDLKKEGTDHWDNALGTNASGLTLLGTGCRMPDGSFASIKKVGGFATSDGNVSKQLGLPIRLIRD